MRGQGLNTHQHDRVKGGVARRKLRVEGELVPAPLLWVLGEWRRDTGILVYICGHAARTAARLLVTKAEGGDAVVRWVERWWCGQDPSWSPRGQRDSDAGSADTTSAQTPSSLRHPSSHASFLFPITPSLRLEGAEGHLLSCLSQLRPQHPAAPMPVPSVQPIPPPPMAPMPSFAGACSVAVSGPGI